MNNAATKEVVHANDDDDGDANEAIPEQGPLFSVSVNMDEVVDMQLKPGLSFQSPNVAVAFKEAVQFDAQSKPLMLVRIPVAGETAKAGDPELRPNREGVPNTVLTINIERQNMDDMLTTVYPKASAAQKARATTALRLEERFGQHVSYQVVNEMFKALAPRQEVWQVVVEVASPYTFSDLDLMTVLSSPEGRDMLIFAPLENTVAAPEAKKVRRLTIGDDPVVA